MSYTLQDNEVGLILRPIFVEGEEDWSGEISTNIIMSGKGEIDTEVKMELLNIITLMSVFLEYGSENPDIMEEVEDYRDELMDKIMTEEMKEAYTTEEGSNLIRLNPFSKTRGNA
jgi:hypothetical protein